MEQGRVEERCVALAQRKLDMVGLEVLAELRPPPSQVARQVLLGVRQVLRGPGLDGHFRVRDRALQGQHRRQAVHVRRELCRLRVRLETQVVVAVHRLCGAPWFDDVDL